MIYFITIAYTLFAAWMFENSVEYKKYKQKQIEKNEKNRYVLMLDKNDIVVFGGMFMVMAPSVFLLAFRYGFGVDYLGTYKNIFEYVISGGEYFSHNNNVELGYLLLNRLVHLFTNNFVWILFVAAVLTYFVISKAILDNSEYFILTVLMLFVSGVYFDSSNLVRQYLAFAFFAIGFKYIKQGNFLKYMICIFFGCLFHQSLFFMFPLYFLRKIELSNKKAIVLVIVSLLCEPLINVFFKFIIKFFPKYAVYLKYYDENANFEMGLVILFVISFIIVLLGSKGDEKKTAEDNLYFIMILMGLVFATLSGTIPFVSRIVIYFKVALVFYIPKVIEESTYNKRIMRMVGYGLFILYFIYTVFVANWYGAVPYKSFLMDNVM